MNHARCEPRTKLFKLARLRTATASGLRAHVLDISPAGARIHCAAALHPGQHVTLEIAGRALRATVLRADDDRAGLRFHARLSEDVVLEIAG